MIEHSRTYKSRKPLPPRLEGAGLGNSDNKTQEIGRRGHPTGADYKEAWPLKIHGNSEKKQKE